MQTRNANLKPGSDRVKQESTGLFFEIKVGGEFLRAPWRAT